MKPKTCAEIHLANLLYNYREIQKKVRPATVIPVVKADAYGHGSVAVAECLAAEGADFFAVAQFEEALELLEQHDGIALVLSDVVMPKMGGISLLKTMKERGLHVTMVMLTGHPVEKELDELQAHGTDSLLADWLSKPVRLEQLASALDRALKARNHP